MDQRETAAGAAKPPIAAASPGIADPPSSRLQSWALVAGRLGAMTTIPRQDSFAA